jgi:DNA repair exonuclease SbcCD ATPase subunit
MIFSFGNLVTILAVLLILAIYRQFDRNNRSLEKVKRYADHIIANLGKQIEEKTREFKDLSIELQVGLKTGKEILARVHRHDEELAGKAENLAALRERLDGYDKALNGLAGMTDRVEENLKRIHSESLFVDQVGKRLQAATDQMQKLEREIPQIEEKFSQVNARHLRAASGQIVKETETRLAEISSSVEGSEGKVKDFSAYITRLEARRDNLEKESIAALKKAFEEFELEAKSRRAALVSQFVASLNKLLNEAEGKGKSFQSAIAASVDKAEQKLAAQNKLLADTARRGETLEAEVFSGLKERIAAGSRQTAAQCESLKQELERVRATEKELKEAMEGLRQGSERIKEDALNRIARSAEELQVKVMSGVEQKLESYEQEMTYRFGKLEEVNVDIEGMEAGLRDLMGKVETRSKEDFAAFDAKLKEQRSGEQERVKQEYAALSTEMRALEEELVALKSRAYQNVSEQLQVFEDEFFADLKERNLAMDAKVRTWQESMVQRLDEISGREVGAREALEKTYAEALRTDLEQLKHTLLEDMKRVETRLTGFEGTIQERLSETEKNIETFSRSSTVRFQQLGEEAMKTFNLELTRMRENVNTRMREMSKEVQVQIEALTAGFAAQRNDLLVASQEERQELRQELKAIAGGMEELQGEVQTRSKAVLEDLQKKLDSFNLEFSRSTREMQEEMSGRLKAIRLTLSEVEARADAQQEELFKTIDERQRSVGTQLEDIDKRIKKFTDQTKLFERADNLKLALEAQVTEMKREIEKVQGRVREVQEIDTRITTSQRVADDVSGKLSKIVNERRRIEDMDADFKKLLSISRDLDMRIETVHSSQDTLQEIQAKIRELESLEKLIETRYERLEKKKEIIETTTTGVDKNFQVLDSLEKNLGAIEGELATFGRQIDVLRRDVETLSADKAQVKAVVEKIGEMDGILSTLEERMQKLDTAREWIAKTETRFEKVGKQAQEQVKLLEGILKQERKQSKSERGAPPMDKREIVTKLAHQGWSPPEIARTTNLSRGEVELILELAPKR